MFMSCFHFALQCFGIYSVLIMPSNAWSRLVGKTQVSCTVLLTEHAHAFKSTSTLALIRWHVLVSLTTSLFRLSASEG